MPYPSVIFLDFDGVLVTGKSLANQSGIWAEADPDCVKALNRITTTTGAGIVVSSAWRIGRSDLELGATLLLWGVTGRFIGSTPRIYLYGDAHKTVSTSRTYEIGAWLKSHPYDQFVILDDTASEIAFKSNFVQTQFETGLTEELADKAIKILHG